MSGATIGLGLALVGSLLAQVFLVLPPSIGSVWLLGIAICVYVVHGRGKRTAALVALRPPGSALRLAGAAVPASVLLGIGLCGIVYVWAGPIRFPIPLPEGNPIDAYIGSPGGWITFTLYAALVAPSIEELAFRGWIQQSVERRWGATAAVAASASLFAAFHFWYSHPQAVLVPLVLGVVWGVAVHVTRSIWAGILLHGAWNATLMLIQRSGIDAASLFFWSHPAVALPLAVLVSAGAASVLGLLWRRHSTRSAARAVADSLP